MKRFKIHKSDWWIFWTHLNISKILNVKILLRLRGISILLRKDFKYSSFVLQCNIPEKAQFLITKISDIKIASGYIFPDTDSPFILIGGVIDLKEEVTFYLPRWMEFSMVCFFPRYLGLVSVIWYFVQRTFHLNILPILINDTLGSDHFHYLLQLGLQMPRFRTRRFLLNLITKNRTGIYSPYLWLKVSEWGLLPTKRILILL